MNELLTLGLVIMCIACVIIAVIATLFYVDIIGFYISISIRVICIASIIAAVIYNRCLAFVVCATCIIMIYITKTAYKEFKYDVDTDDVFYLPFKYFGIKVMLPLILICTLFICIFLK